LTASSSKGAITLVVDWTWRSIIPLSNVPHPVLSEGSTTTSGECLCLVHPDEVTKEIPRIEEDDDEKESGWWRGRKGSEKRDDFGSFTRVDV